MKKFNLLFVLLFAVLTSGVFVSCSGSDDDPEEDWTTGDAAKRRIEVLFSGDVAKFSPAVSFTPGVYNTDGSPVVDWNTVVNGKKISTEDDLDWSYSDDPRMTVYAESGNNCFVMACGVLVATRDDGEGTMEITIKAYKNGTLVKTESYTYKAGTKYEPTISFLFSE